MNLAIFWTFVIALVFVFHGEPDLFDKWHADAMGIGCKK